MKQVDRHRVEHFVGDDDAGHRLGQRVEPAEAVGQRARRFALALAQRRRQLDDRVTADAIAERCQQLGRERAAAGAEFKDLVAAARLERLPDLARQGAAEQRRQLGRGDEVASRRGHAADDGSPARVVAEAGRVKGQRHEAAERDPAAGAIDGHADQSRESRRYTAVVQALMHRRIVGIVVAPSAFANVAAGAADSSGGRDAAPRRKLPVEIAKLKKRLHRQVGRAIADFAMIEDGDRVMVCVSGGKDSYSLLDILIELRERAPIEFSIVAVNLDQKQPGFPAEVLPGYLAGLGVDYRIVEQDTYSVVKRLVPEGRTMCSLCSRLRRGVLYRVASELGATKIALGHHRDDMVATLFMNMFFGGRLKGMPPKLVSDDGRHVVIRPLAYVAERDLVRWAEEREFPIIPCNLCGSQQNLQRVRIGEMLRGWEREDPGRIDRIFDAMATRRALASHGPETVSVRRAPTDRRRRRRRRPRLRRRRSGIPGRGRAGPRRRRAALQRRADAVAASRRSGMTRTLAALIAGAALSGCAALYNIDADVSSFSRWPAGRGPATYAFERLPSQQAHPQQAQMLEDAARRAIEGSGLVAAPEGGAPDVTVQLGARITETGLSYYDDPFWYGGMYPWHRPFGYGRYGRPYWGPYWGPYGGGGWYRGYGGYYSPYYDREAAVLIRDKRSGEPLYEARAQSQGPTTGLTTVLPALFVAAMKDFPTGSTTNPRRITVEMAR